MMIIDDATEAGRLAEALITDLEQQQAATLQARRSVAGPVAEARSVFRARVVPALHPVFERVVEARLGLLAGPPPAAPGPLAPGPVRPGPAMARAVTAPRGVTIPASRPVPRRRRLAAIWVFLIALALSMALAGGSVYITRLAEMTGPVACPPRTAIQVERFKGVDLRGRKYTGAKTICASPEGKKTGPRINPFFVLWSAYLVVLLAGFGLYRLVRR
jgi:hypothetical protein